MENEKKIDEKEMESYLMNVVKKAIEEYLPKLLDRKMEEYLTKAVEKAIKITEGDTDEISEAVSIIVRRYKDEMELPESFTLEKRYYFDEDIKKIFAQIVLTYPVDYGKDKKENEISNIYT